MDGKELVPYYPKLYYVGQKGTIFNWKNFAIWYISGITHAVIVAIVPYFIF